ncbi:uncharacterized protein LOC135496681 [Lineus longissimus]|uniref:uncharacterized protein LOC135496681 n=1 Tax=Lineus longissimus TaxID=88925 RepID=UPI00315D7E75
MYKANRKTFHHETGVEKKSESDVTDLVENVDMFLPESPGPQLAEFSDEEEEGVLDGMVNLPAPQMEPRTDQSESLDNNDEELEETLCPSVRPADLEENENSESLQTVGTDNEHDDSYQPNSSPIDLDTDAQMMALDLEGSDFDLLQSDLPVGDQSSATHVTLLSEEVEERKTFGAQGYEGDTSTGPQSYQGDYSVGVQSYDLELFQSNLCHKEESECKKGELQLESQKSEFDRDNCTRNTEASMTDTTTSCKKKKRSKKRRLREKCKESQSLDDDASGLSNRQNTHVAVFTAPIDQVSHLNLNSYDNHGHESDSDGYPSPNDHAVFKMTPTHILPSLNRSGDSKNASLQPFESYKALPKIGELPDVNGNDKVVGQDSTEKDVEKGDENKHKRLVDEDGHDEVPEGVVWTSEAYDAMEKRLKTKPSFFCRTLATRPIASFLFFLFFHATFIAVTIGLYFGGYAIFPIDFESTPVNLMDDPSFLRNEAFKTRDDNLNVEYRFVMDWYSMFPNWLRGREDERIELFFEALDGSGNMFTQKNLKLLEQIERHLFQLKDFQSYYCLYTAYLECKQPESILRFFDGTYKNIDSVFDDPDFENIAQVLFMAEHYNETKDEVQKYLGKNAVITREKAKSAITRSFQVFGYPKRNPSDVKDTNNYIYQDFKPEMDRLQKESPAVGFYYYNKPIYKEDTRRQAFADFALAGGSFLFIFAFMLYHTRSAWITFWSVFSIITSFLIANLVYRIVFGYIYFGFFHVASVFIILGIGVDDVFVYYDIWRSTDFYRYPTFAHRVSDCYHRAAKVMFATSLTTMMAFFVSAFSPLFMVKTFGLFTGLLILMNYLSVITFIPTVVVIYHLKFEQNCCLCCSCAVTKVAPERLIVSYGEPCQTTSNSDQTSSQSRQTGETEQRSSHLNQVKVSHSKQKTSHPEDQSVNINETKKKSTVDDIKEVLKDRLQCLCTICGRHCHKQTKSATEYQQHNMPREQKRKNILIRFFRGPYYKLITHKVARWIILVLFLGLVISSIYFCTQIRPDEEPFKLYKPNHNYGKSMHYRVYGFRPTDIDRYIYMYFVWGVKGYDLSRCNLKDVWDIEHCRGKTVFDDEFDMNRPGVQEAMMQFCQAMMDMPQDDIDAFKVAVDVAGKPQVECFMTDLHKFLMKEKASSDFYPDDLDLNYPLDETKMRRFMSYHPQIYNMSALPPGFNNWFEIAVNYWLSDGYQMLLTPDFLIYNWKLTEVTTKHTVDIPGFYQTYGNKLRYAAVRVNLTLNSYTQNYVEGLPIMNKWESYLAGWSKQLPAHSNKPFMVTPGITNVYHWMKVQAALSYQAVLGLAVGISLAFPVLVLATQNIIVGTLATVSIALTTVSVCAMIPLAGWKLGVMESLNLCLVVSLAVDYVVHLAEGYFYTPFDNRKGRTYKMLEDVAISVFSGAATTLGAALFLLFTVIMFYLQFGVFLFCTIGFSIVYALGFFSLLMPMIGPEKEFGSLKPLWSWIKRRLLCPKHKK